MLSDICIHFPEARAWFDLMDRAFSSQRRSHLPSQVIFPPPPQDTGPGNGQDGRLWQMDYGPESVFAANQALWTIVSSLGIQPQGLVGHSTGEYSALFASGALQVADEDRLAAHIVDLNGIYNRLAAARKIPEAPLVAVGGVNRALIEEVVQQSNGHLFLAMDNCPNQLVLCGHDAAIESAVERLAAAGAFCVSLPFQRAYHTPLFEPVCRELEGFMERLDVVAPRIRLFSCATACAYPQAPAELRSLAVGQWRQPVRFQDTVRTMYEEGFRIFVELGPSGTLTGFVNDILRDQPHLAVAASSQRWSGITQLAHLVGLLAAHGVPMRLGPLYQRRDPQHISLDAPPEAAGGPERRTRPMPLAMGLQPLRLADDEALHRPRPADRPPPSPGSATPERSALEGDRAAVSGWKGSPSSPSIEGGSAGSQGGQQPWERPGAIPPATVQAATAISPDRYPSAMSAYFDTMEQFLDVQAMVMRRFLTEDPPRPSVGRRGQGQDDSPGQGRVGPEPGAPDGRSAFAPQPELVQHMAEAAAPARLAPAFPATDGGSSAQGRAAHGGEMAADPASAMQYHHMVEPAPPRPTSRVSPSSARSCRFALEAS